ncbi:MAG TPA: nitroreductase family deazaflavin-dependent oxidoreductase [Ktedonobacterales bacterium]
MTEEQLTSAEEGRAGILAQRAGEDACLLTTYDRDSGLVHEVPMRYAVQGGNVYMLSDAGGDAEWVKNLVINPEVSIRIGSDTVAGMARVIVNNAAEERLARHLLAAKYEGWREGEPLSPWASDALPVVIETKV